MKEAQGKTVSLDGLPSKIGDKYVKYFEKKVNHKKKATG